MEKINLDIVSKEQLTDWIWYGILHNNLDTKIIDDILSDINEGDEDKQDFAREILTRSAEVYFKLGIQVAKLI